MFWVWNLSQNHPKAASKHWDKILENKLNLAILMDEICWKLCWDVLKRAKSYEKKTNSSQTVVDCESNEKGRILSIYSNKKDETNGDYNYLVNCVVNCCECLGGIIVLSMAAERHLFCSHLPPPPPPHRIVKFHYPSYWLRFVI